ncbi:MAG: HAD family hydrolase [Campylobacterota bacterium]|nr:HAD family hydrolase [Campylobacterota bacterium]
MPNRIFMFSDIDDTLIQTGRKTDFDKNTVVGGYTKEGKENSFFYEGTKVLIDTLIDSNITFIPTTARDIASYNRTIFPQKERIKYAILNFGGTILIDNEIDREWKEKMDQEYNKIESIDTVLNELLYDFKNAGLNLVVKTIADFYISVYNKYSIDDAGILEQVKDVLSDFIDKNGDFYLYENDNSFGILPNFLNKKFAVEHLIEKEQPILTIGAGDNLSDLDFMNLTSFQLVPNNSFIHKSYR